MSGKYLLDTSIAIDLLRGASAIRERFAGASGVCIASAVLGELLFGAQRSSKPLQNVAEIEEFLADCSVVVCDENTARVYARVKAGLASKGKPIPENDIWIAASAIQHDLILAARDAHFRWIDGLAIEQW